MDLRVLGPLEAHGDDGPVSLKGLRQRAVLAVLAIEAGRVVSTDQLAELVWDGTPPDQAPASLQAYISKLRRALEPDRDGRGKPWQLLVTRAPGYVLEIDPLDVDAGRFERTVDDAAERLAAGDAAGALTGLDEGLATWRGDPYADFTFSGFARNEINRLHELRWRAIEDRAEALLLLGRHRDVAAELDGLVAQAPLRERLRGQLMLALYRSGRQADALACFAEGRTVLVEELGLDPGPELRRLEQAILEQSADLDWQAATLPTTERPAAEPAATAPSAAPAAPSTATTAGAEPSPTRPRSTASVAPGRPAMVGRDPELSAVVDTVRAAGAGEGSFTLVLGDAGIGKTRLLEEVAACAAADGVRTIWGRCPELEGVPPFWPWVQVLRALAADAGPDGTTPDPVLATLVPELVPDGAGRPDVLAADSDAGRFRLFDAVSRYVLAEAARRPVTVLLEDLHWADAASLRLLRFLVPQLATGHLAIVATTRHSEGSDALDELRADAARWAAARRVELHGLDRDAIRDLTTRLAGSPVGPAVLDTLAERSAGNPFFLGELIRLGEAGDAGVPSGVRDVIQRRVGQLDDRARELLTLAACCPGDAELDLLAPVLGRSALAVLDDVDAALAARLVIEVPERPGAIRFSHPLVRDAVYGELAAARRAYLHGALGRELERRVLATGPAPRPDDERIAALAHHFVAGAAVGTRAEAVRWSLAAGEQDLARWAADEAHRHFETALELARAEPSAGESAVVDALIGAGRARRFLGDNGGRDAIDAALALARKISDPVRTVRAAVATGFDAWGLGSAFGIVDPELRAALEWALPLLGPDEAELHVLGLTILAGELVFAEDRTLAPDLAADALAEARALGRPEPLAAALMARWIAVWGPDSVAERAGLLTELEALVEADVVDPARWLLLRWTQALEVVDTDELDAVLERTDALSADGNHPALELLGAWRRSLRTILDGRFTEAEALVGAAHELAERANPREAFDASGGQLTLLYWQWGRLGELAPFLAAAVEEQPYLRTAFGPASALSWAQAGDHEQAREVIASLGLDAFPDAPPTPMLRSGTTTTLAATACELGDRDLAEVALRFLGEHPGSPAVIDHVGTFYLGARAGFRGALLLLLDRLDEAIAELEAARSLNERMGAVVFLLRNDLDLADALQRRGGGDDAERIVALLDAAEARATDLGIDEDVERARALRAAPA